MGTAKVKKRTSLQKQFIITFGWILLLSALTSLAAGVVIYNTAFGISGNPAYKYFEKERLARLTQFLEQYGMSVIDRNHRKELKRIIGDEAAGYFVLDMHGYMIFGSNVTLNGGKTHHGAFSNWLQHGESDLNHTSNIFIPIHDKATGKNVGTLVLIFDKTAHRTAFVLVEFIGPFICLLFYTLVFAGNLSREIRKPLRELMNATKKIKARDLNFSVDCTEDNEIGDLARALEEMRAELKRSLIREWQLEQDRRDMVAALTHDLRTPVAIIQGHVEGLQDGLKADPVKLDGYLDTISHNAFRVKNLVDEMNMLVEVESVDFEINPQPVNLKEFLRRRVNDLQILAAKKNIRIEAQIINAPKDDSTVLMDSGRLAQVIDNIIGNSIRFTPTGGRIQLTVAAEELLVRFTVRDSGPGFSENDRPHLFKKFYKGDLSRSLEKGHSGLGLYIARMIIEKHGGSIKAANLPDGGACVEFTVKY